MSYNANDIVSLSQGRAFREKIGYSNYIFFEDGSVYSLKSKKYLKPIKKNTGYMGLNLFDDNHQVKMLFIHRIIAELFLDNLNNLPVVNHKDEDKTNNHVNNLEWCDRRYNESYGTKRAREIITKTNNKCRNGRKPISQYTLKNVHIKDYDSLTEAYLLTGVSIGNISSVINGIRNNAGGYLWKVQ